MTEFESNVEPFDPKPIRDLPSRLPEAPQLAPDMIPSSLRPWIQDAAERSQVPIDFIAVPAIIALSSLIGRSVGIHPKQNDDWLVVSNLWGAVIGRPGVQKSPAVAEGLKPLHRLAARAREEFEDEAATADARATISKARAELAKDDVKKAVKGGDDHKLASAEQDLILANQELEQSEVTARRYIVNDGTVEKIGELLNENPRGLLLTRDELSGLLQSLDKPGREGDREFYLEAWNGAGSFVYDRIGRGTVHIPALCLSVVGTIQPGKLQRYIAKALSGGGGDDGLIQRMQLAVWPEISPAWENIDRSPDRAARQVAYDVFERIDSLAPGDIGCTDEVDGIATIRFTAEAQVLFDRYHAELEAKLRSDDLINAPAYVSHLSKYRSLCPSLALIFHVAEVVNGAMPGGVSFDAAKQAIRWCEFLEQHARKIYAGELNAELLAAHSISQKIREGSIEDGQKVRDIYRHHWSGLTVAELVWGGLDLLQKHNHLSIERENSGGRPADIIRLNPRLSRKLS